MYGEGWKQCLVALSPLPDFTKGFAQHPGFGYDYMCLNMDNVLRETMVSYVIVLACSTSAVLEKPPHVASYKSNRSLKGMLNYHRFPYPSLYLL